MSLAILTQDIIAQNEDGESKVYPQGLEIDVEDWDDEWFSFYNDDLDMGINCDEKPSAVLSFNDDETDAKSQQYPVTEDEAYVPKPNMVPMNRKYLLL